MALKVINKKKTRDLNFYIEKQRYAGYYVM